MGFFKDNSFVFATMDIIDRALGRSKTTRVIERAPAKSAKRGYEAGRTSRLFADWIADSRSINRDIRAGGKRIRYRSRDLFRNNPYVSSVDIKTKTNIVGWDGFRLQVKSNNDVLNELIEKKFLLWCRKKYCTMSKRLDFVRVQWLVLRRLWEDGEFIVRCVDKLPTDVNPFGMSLELLDPDDIDETYNEDLGNGNVVIMGVEINQWYEIKALYFKGNSYKTELTGGEVYTTKRNRIDASELIYDFDIEHPKQVRAVTKLASVMTALKGIDRWDEDSLINATFSARKMGFLYAESLDAEDQYLGGDESVEDEESEVDEKGYDENVSAESSRGKKYMDLEAGSIESLPYGWKFQGFDPKFPQEQHAPFLKTMLRKIASALGLSYNSFANDLEGVNFSSMRSGLNEERSVWKVNQSLFRSAFLVPLYEKWLYSAMSTGELGISLRRYNEFLEHSWMGREWDWIDPLKDEQANNLALANNTTSKIRICQKKGIEYEDVLRDLKKQKELEKKYGFDFPLYNDETNIKINNEDDNDEAEDKTNETDEVGRNKIFAIQRT